MIDITRDDLIPLGQVARRFTNPASGKHFATATIGRWATRGVRGGVKLEAVLVGGKWWTTEDALRAFQQSLNTTFSPQQRRSTAGRRAFAAAKSKGLSPK